MLAQMGAYVPAERAKIGLIDRLYCRVGASDNLAKGQSTFMVEMVETAAILNQATHRSLIILDEIGRGTATFDGLSIAWASLEYIHNVLKCRALFATHYHELTNLQKSLPYLSCYTLAIEEHDNELLFLHKVIPGSMNRSFGIHVAELAGLPQAVIIRAKQVLKKLESSERQQPALLKIQPDLFEYANEVTRPVATTPPEEISPLEVDLANLNLDMLTPKEALNWLYEKKQCLKKIVSN